MTGILALGIIVLPLSVFLLVRAMLAEQRVGRKSNYYCYVGDNNGRINSYKESFPTGALLTKQK